MADETSPSDPPNLTVDVPALAALLDGKYADIRRAVRETLPTYAGVLEDAENLPASFHLLVGGTQLLPCRLVRTMAGEAGVEYLRRAS